jgi:hypothetical protein
MEYVPFPLPLLTRREIAREYRPDQTVTIESALRSLRDKGALSGGLSIELRSSGGRLGGRTHVYSSLNRDAARAARHKHFIAAVRLAKAAGELESSQAAATIAARLAAGPRIEGAADLARALSNPALGEAVAELHVMYARVQRELGDSTTTQLGGHVLELDDVKALLLLDGLPAPLTVPRPMVEVVGVGAVGAPVIAIWELLPGGASLMTVEPAVDAPDDDADQPLVDLYGTPWGRVLAGTDPERLTVAGASTISIPAGIPDVE